MKIYSNKRDVKQLERILGLGWTELKKDFFLTLEVGKKSGSLWVLIGAETKRGETHKKRNVLGWKEQHFGLKKGNTFKKKREAELKGRTALNWEHEAAETKTRDFFWASICPYKLLRYIMVNSFLLSLIFSMN